MADEPQPLTFLAKRGTLARRSGPLSDDHPKPTDFLGQAGLHSSYQNQRRPSQDVEDDCSEPEEKRRLHKTSSFEFPPPLASLPSLSKIVINRKPRRKTKNLTPTPFWLHPPQEQERSNSRVGPRASQVPPPKTIHTDSDLGEPATPSAMAPDPEEPTAVNLPAKVPADPTTKPAEDESLAQYRSRMLERATVRRNRAESATRRQTPLTDTELDAWLRGSERHPHLRQSISKEIVVKPPAPPSHRSSRGDSLQPSEAGSSSPTLLEASAVPTREGHQVTKLHEGAFPPPKELNRFESALGTSFQSIESVFRMYPRDGNILMEALSTLKDFYAKDITATREMRLSVFSKKSVQKRQEMLQPARKEVATLQQRIEASLNELKRYTNWEEGVLKGESTRLAEVKAAAEKAKEHLGVSKAEVANNLIIISSLFEQQAQQSLEIDEIEELEQQVAEAEARKTELSIKESALVKQLSRERKALAQWGTASEYDELGHRVSEKGSVLPGKKVALLRQVKSLEGRKAGLEAQLKVIEAENSSLDSQLAALKEQYRSREAVELRAWTPRPNIDKECPQLEKELRVKGAATVQSSGRSTASLLEASIKKLLQQQSNLRRLQEELVRFYHILAPVARPFDAGRGAQLPFLPGSQLSVYFPAAAFEDGPGSVGAELPSQSPTKQMLGLVSPPSSVVGNLDPTDSPSTHRGAGSGLPGRRPPPSVDSLGRQTSTNTTLQQSGPLSAVQSPALSPQVQPSPQGFSAAPSGPFASTTRWWPTYNNEDGVHAFLSFDLDSIPNENWSLPFTDRVAFVVLKTIASSKGAAALKASTPVSPGVSSNNLSSSGSAFLVEVFTPAIIAIWGPMIDVRIKLVNLVMHCKRYASQCPLLVCLLHIIGGRLPVNFAEGPIGFVQRLLSPCASSGSETPLKNLFILMVKEMDQVPFSSIELMQLRYALLCDCCCNATTRTVRWRDLLDCYDGKAALATLQAMWVQQTSGDGDISTSVEATAAKLTGSSGLSLSKSALGSSLTERGKSQIASPAGNPASPTQLAAGSPKTASGDAFPMSPSLKPKASGEGAAPVNAMVKSTEPPGSPVSGQNPVNKTGLFLRTVFFHYFVHMTFAYSKIEALIKSSTLTSELHPFVALIDAQVFKVKLEALRWESHEVQGFKAVKYHEHKVCAVQVKHLLDQLKLRCGLFAGSLHFTQETAQSLPTHSGAVKTSGESTDLVDPVDAPAPELVGSKAKPYFELAGVLSHLREIPLKITFKVRKEDEFLEHQADSSEVSRPANISLFPLPYHITPSLPRRSATVMSASGTTPRPAGKRILHALGKGGAKGSTGNLSESPSSALPAEKDEESKVIERKRSENKLGDPLQRSASMESTSNAQTPRQDNGTPGQQKASVIDFGETPEAVTPRAQERRQSEAMTSSDLRNLKSALSGITSTFQREIQETLKAFKEVSESIRTAKIYALTETQLLDWSTRIEGLSNLITDVVHTGITSISDALDPSAKKAMEESNRKIRKFNFAEVVRKVENVVQHSQGLKGGSPVVEQKSNSGVPKLTPRKPQQQGDGSALLGSSVNGGRPRKLSSDSGEKTTVAANYFKHSTSSTFMDTAAVGEALQTNRKAQCMAASLHVILDSVMRTTKSEKVCVYVPFRGDISDLCVVSAVGYGPDVNLHDLRLRDAHSVPSLTLQTGMLIAVCRGHNPAREVQETIAHLNQSLHDNPFRSHLVPLDSEVPFSPTNGKGIPGADQSTNSVPGSSSHRSPTLSTPTHGTIGTPKSIVQLHRAKYWSGLSVPIRLFNQVKPTAVLQVINKNFGNSNYDAEDEHYLHGVAQLLAGLFERFDDYDMLVKLFDPQLPLPPVHSAAGIHSVTPRGLREQLVYHTWDTAHGREVKILLGDGSQNQVATKLDDTTPLIRVVDYIVKLQEMWKQSVLANLEYQKAHQDRTAYVKMLVDRVRMAELRCEVLTSEALKNVHIDENTKPTWFLPSNREAEIGYVVPEEAVIETSPLATTKPSVSEPEVDPPTSSGQALESQESSECFNLDAEIPYVDASTQTDEVNPLLQDLPETHPVSRGELLDLDGGVAGRSTGSIVGSKHSLNKPHPLSSMTKEVRQEKLNGEGGAASFRVGGEIGRGAHGTVHSALIEETGETVAAKKIIMSTQLPDDELDAKLESLQLELNLLKALDHPNIVRFLFSRRLPAEEGQGLLIFMEFVAGGSLQSIISDFGPLPERTAAIFAAQILLGLEYLHSKQVIHRDIKPANCLVGHLGEVKLSDFGTAMLIDNTSLRSQGATSVGPQGSDSFSGRNTPAAASPVPAPTTAEPSKYRYAGTPLYMAPEVIQKKAYTAAVDIWSFGCTLMQLVTGQLPWTHWKLSVKDLLTELTKGSEPLPMPPGLSKELTNFLEVCLQREPSKRPTASELIAHPWFAAFDILEVAPSSGAVPMELSERSFNLKVSVRDEFASSVIQGFGASLNVTRPSPMPPTPVAAAKAVPEPPPPVATPSIRSVGSAEEDDDVWAEEVVVLRPAPSES